MIMVTGRVVKLVYTLALGASALKAWRFESSPAHHKIYMKNKTSKYVPGERIIFNVRPSFVILLAEIVPLFIVMIGVIFLFSYAGLNNVWVIAGTMIAGIIAALGIFMHWRFTSYILTTKRVENRYGVIGSREEQISLNDVEAVNVDTTFIGALLNFGTVIIKAAGEQREVDFVNIANPKVVANKIQDMSIEEGSSDPRE